MASCLGLYVENNLIKYAKVSKDHDDLKVEAFGIQFYDNLGDAINQVIEETYSYKTPISINLSDEMYTYFDVFSLLGKNYLPKVIKTEFESYCIEKGYNPNVFETRYAVVDDLKDKEKNKVINISANKLELNRRTQELAPYKLTTVSPISMAITNIAEIGEKQNTLIVNMEENTTITTIINQKIYNVDIIDEGASDVLNRINTKENSYAKAYEACKNTTIYTIEGRDLGQDNGYLDDILPTLNKIASQVGQIISDSLAEIKQVYLTGTLTCVNNIDLYFQEYLPNVECKILKPNFETIDSSEISVRDYIEVNSAIALGVQGLGLGVTGMNFKQNSFKDKFASSGKVKEKAGNGLKTEVDLKGLFKNDLGTALTQGERMMLRIAAGILLIIIIYSAFSMFLNSQINKKENEVNDLIAQTQEQINLAKKDKDTVDKRTNDYKSLTKALEDLNNRISDINQSRNIIPNLLNQIMFVVPEQVQIVSIENTTDRHIVIVAQSDKYEQLGYFKVKLRTDGILSDVISDSGVSSGSVVKVTIEGDIP